MTRYRPSPRGSGDRTGGLHDRPYECPETRRTDPSGVPRMHPSGSTSTSRRPRVEHVVTDHDPRQTLESVTTRRVATSRCQVLAESDLISPRGLPAPCVAAPRHVPGTVPGTGLAPARPSQETQRIDGPHGAAAPSGNLVSSVSSLLSAAATPLSAVAPSGLPACATAMASDLRPWRCGASRTGVPGVWPPERPDDVLTSRGPGSRHRPRTVEAGAVRVLRADRGSVMPMTTAFVALVMVGVFALISASQAWGERRHIQGVADAAARAGAQMDGADARRGLTIDPAAAAARASAVAAGTGVTVTAVVVAGLQVTVSVTGAVDYAFPAPGLPTSMSASGSAIAQTGIVSAGG